MNKIKQFFSKENFQKVTSGLKASFAKHRVRWIVLTIVGVLLVAGAIVLFAPTGSKTNARTIAARTGRIVTSISATGTVRAAQTVTLAWQTTGEIDKVAVNVGDKVSKGEQLADLVTSSLPQDVILAQSDLVSAQENLDSVTNSYTATANAQLALAQAQVALENAQNKVTSTQLVEGTSDQIDAANATLVLAQAALTKAQNNLDKYSKVDPSNPQYAQAYSQFASAQQAEASAQTNYDLLQGHYSASQASVSAGQLAVAQAAYDDAKRNWQRLQNGPDQADIAAAQAKVNSAQALLDEAFLSAPFNGTVTQIFAAAGDQVSTIGTNAIRIDDLSKYLINISVSEMDISSVKVGQAATIVFDAIPNKTYNGTVTSVSQAGTISQNLTYFTVTIELTDANSQVLPGMTATANVVSNEIDNALLVPTTAIQTTFNRKTVYVLRNGSPVVESVTTGSVSGIFTQILTGTIKAGDLIVTNPTTMTTNNSLFQSLLGGGAAAGGARFTTGGAGGFTGGGAGGFTGGGAGGFTGGGAAGGAGR
jgi:HlyD family secretion protein